MQSRVIRVCIGIGLACLAAMPFSDAQSSAVAVVVNEKNLVHNLTTSELRRLFAGERHSWPGGRPVRLFVRAPGAYERVVLLRLLGMSEKEYKQFWTAAVFRGEAQVEPVALFSNGMQKEAITSFPGAIALVDLQDVKSGMRVVRINGHLPGETGYPLN
jgi:ABC-type phosphate transport system substrate-binding protein